MNDDVSYNGKTIKKSELPVVDYHVPFSAKFRHSAKFSGFSVSNFINYTSKTDALLGGWNRTRGMYVYERQKLPAYATWDMRIGYERRPWPQLLAGSGGKVVAVLPLTRLFSRFFLWYF